MESKYFSDYKMAIESLVAFAKATNFDSEGDFDKLIKDWILQSKKQHEEIMNRKTAVIQIVKAILK